MKQTTFFRFILITILFSFCSQANIFAQNSGTTGWLSWSVSPTTGNNRTLSINAISLSGPMPDYSNSEPDFPPWQHLKQFISRISIGNSVISIGVSAFQGCSGITTLTIPNSVTTIGNSAFSGCSNITELTIGNGVTTIALSTFSGCSGLTSIIIPENVTSIGNSAFQSCSGLTSVTIGNSVTSIGNSAFQNCSSITAITSYPATPPIISSSTFSNVPTSIPVYIPCTSLNAYRFASGWNRFTNYQIMAGTAPSPSQPGTISGTTTVCLGSGTQTYSISAVPNATSYTWSLPNGWTGNSTNTSISAIPGSNAQSGNISVTANNVCGSSLERTLAVIVNTVPTQPNTISGSTTVYIGSGTQIYNISEVADATNYTWNS